MSVKKQKSLEFSKERAKEVFPYALYIATAKGSLTQPLGGIIIRNKNNTTTTPRVLF